MTGLCIAVCPHCGEELAVAALPEPETPQVAGFMVGDHGVVTGATVLPEQPALVSESKEGMTYAGPWPPPALDVERLAAALLVTRLRIGYPDEVLHDMAEAITAEYARLTSQTAEGWGSRDRSKAWEPDR